MPRTLVLTIIFTLIVYFMVHLKQTAAAYFTFWLIVFISVSLVESMALCVSTALPNPQV